MTGTTASSRPTPSFRSRLAAFAEAFGGAVDCAGAAETGRQPSRRALRAVGIDAAQWDRINRR